MNFRRDLGKGTPTRIPGVSRCGAPGRTRTSTDVNPPDFESGASTNSATGARRVGGRPSKGAEGPLEAAGIINKIAGSARLRKHVSAAQKPCLGNGLESSADSAFLADVALQQSALDLS